MPNVLINFPVDNTEILATVELLEKIGQVEKGTADAFKKSAAERKVASDLANEALKNTARNLQDVQKLIAGGAIEEAFKKLGQEVQKTEVKTTSLKAQLRAMKNELATLEEGGKKFNDLSIKAAKLEDKIGDVQARVRNLASDTKGINALISGAQGITGAFAVAQGAVGLFGTDTEQMQKTLLKVNSAMAILQGLQQIQVVLFEESAAKSVLAATGQQIYATVVGESTGALKAFRIAAAGAIAATGIGIIIALIVYWDDLKDAITGASDVSRTFQESQKEVTKQVSDFNVKLLEVRGALDAAKAGTLSKEAALKQYNDTLGSTLGFASNLQQAEDLYATNTPIVIKSIMLRAQAQVFAGKAAEASAKLLTGEGIELDVWQKLEVGLRAMVNPFNAAAVAADKTAGNVKELTDQQAIFEKQQENLLKLAYENDALLKKGANDPNAKTVGPTPEQLNKAAADSKKYQDEKAQREIDRNLETIEFLEADDKKAKEDKEKRDKESDKKHQDVGMEQAKGEIEVAKQTAKEKLDIEKKLADEKQALKDAEFQLASTTIDALQTINQAATDYEIGRLDEQLRKGLISREQYEKRVRKIKHDAAERDKVLAIFNIGLSTAEAIMKALATDGPAGPVLAIAAGIAGAAQLAAVASKPIPAFEKGTKKAPPGFKWVGEKGKELIHTPGGDTIFDHKKSLQIAQMFDTPNLILPEYYSTLSNTKDFDYDKLGKAIAKNIPANKLPEITITDNSGLIAYHKKYHG